MATAPIHENLLAWQVAIDLAAAIYRVSATFPDSERYGITSQVRRAAVSISSNIAEGTGRASRRETGHFLSVARGFLREVQSLLSLAERLGYARNEELSAVREMCERAAMLIGGLRRSVLRKQEAEV